MLWKRSLQFSAAAIAASVLLIFCFAAWVLSGVVRNPVAGFELRKGELSEVRETARWLRGDDWIREISLDSDSGLHVELALRTPRNAPANAPLVVLMGGQETGRQAVEVIPETHGAVVAALSYPFAEIPFRHGFALALSLRAIQRGILDTTPAVMLIFDYLLDHAGLTPTSVDLVGVSFGAFLVAVPGALESRHDRTWLIHGAGDPEEVLAHGLIERVGMAPVSRAVAWFLAASAGAHYLGPELWVGRIDPKTLIVVSARQETALSRKAVASLHRVLPASVEVLWTDGDHVHPKRAEVMREIADLIFVRIAGEGQRGV